jgi:hypothetical protein
MGSVVMAGVIYPGKFPNFEATEVLLEARQAVTRTTTSRGNRPRRFAFLARQFR